MVVQPGSPIVPQSSKHSQAPWSLQNARPLQSSSSLHGYRGMALDGAPAWTRRVEAGVKYSTHSPITGVKIEQQMEGVFIVLC